MKKRNKLAAVSVNVFLILAAVLCLSTATQVMHKGYVSFAGYSTFRVVTGSMEPTISTGALLVAKQTDIAQIREGDIICFRSKEPLVYGEIVTHRVVEKQTGEDGNDYLKTRGDANSAVDGFLVSEEELVGRVVWYTGQKNVFTGILSLLTTRYGFLSCILLPILVIAILIMRDSIRSIRQELYLMQQELEKREQEEAAEEPLEDALWSPEEYEELVNRLKRELIEELSEHAEIDDTGDIHGQGK